MTHQSHFVVLFSYHWHTTHRLFEQASQLSDAQYYEHPGFGHGSLHDLFFHILRTDRAWRIALTTGSQPAAIGLESFATRAAIRAGFVEEQAAWDLLLATLMPEEYDQPIDLTTLRGDRIAWMRWRVLQHLILHGMQHHSDIARLLTAMGQSPGDIDFVFYRG